MTSVFWMSLLYLNLFSSRHPEEIKLYQILYKDQICMSYNAIKNRSNKTRIDAWPTNNHLPFHENDIWVFDTFLKKSESKELASPIVHYEYNSNAFTKAYLLRAENRLKNQNVSFQIPFNPWVIWNLFTTIISVNISYSQSILKLILEAWWKVFNEDGLETFFVTVWATHRSVSDYVNSEIIKWLLGCQQCDRRRRDGVYLGYLNLEKRTGQIISQNPFWLSFCDSKELSVQTMYLNTHSHKCLWFFLFFFCKHSWGRRKKINREKMLNIFSATKYVNNILCIFQIPSCGTQTNLLFKNRRYYFSSVSSLLKFIFLRLWHSLLAVFWAVTNCFMSFSIDNCNIIEVLFRLIQNSFSEHQGLKIMCHTTLHQNIMKQ